MLAELVKRSGNLMDVRGGIYVHLCWWDVSYMIYYENARVRSLVKPCSRLRRVNSLECTVIEESKFHEFNYSSGDIRYDLRCTYIADIDGTLSPTFLSEMEEQLGSISCTHF